MLVLLSASLRRYKRPLAPFECVQKQQCNKHANAEAAISLGWGQMIQLGDICPDYPGLNCENWEDLQKKKKKSVDAFEL